MVTKRIRKRINTSKAKKQRQIRELQNKKYGTYKCKWCEKRFTRKHTRQQYCSQNCAYQAKLDNDRQWHHKHKQHKKRLGTGLITGTPNKNTDIEKKIISKEKKRLGI